MSPFDKEIMARTLWAEARGEGTEGIRAVAHAILNRFTAGKWYSGKTVSEACLFPAQFSCWNDNDPNRRELARLADDDSALLACRGMVERVCAGDDDSTFGSTHYYAASMKVAPRWASSGQLKVQIGAHKFYTGVA